MYWIYDIETYPNCFTFTAISSDRSQSLVIECSTRKNEIAHLFAFLDELRRKKHWMVGYNNLDFDYPVIHDLLSVRDKAVTVGGKAVAVRAYKKAMELINSEEMFGRAVKTKDEHVAQIDLYKVNHFDNKARATSLKALEFNMKSDTIEDLPFDPGTVLTDEQIDMLLTYNMHDVKETAKFFDLNKSQIDFRHQLTEKYKKSFMNHNDTKIGKDYFLMRLEEEIPGIVYKKGGGINQTIRDEINIGECLFDYYDFKTPAFNAVLEWFRNKTITETKGVLSDITEYDLGGVARYAELLTKKRKIPETSAESFTAEMPMSWVEQRELKTKVKGVQQYSTLHCYNFATNLNVVVNGFRFDFGTGGIHGSIPAGVVRSDKDCVIIDADV